mmetsp:Transcript_10728/g.20909  ORF Transcript_10728/g.20909 Transcript_10728/m.20909 type:complete len:239 (+) Transcript_10728:112-828(+)
MQKSKTASANHKGHICCMLPKLKSIALGQALSMIDTGFGVFSTLMLLLGLDIPLFMLFVFYSALALVYSPLLVCKNLRLSWPDVWKVFAASITDSQGNFLVVMSYKYTSLTSVFILMNSSVPYVMLLSYIFIKKVYRPSELAGVFLALLGILCVIISDLRQQGWAWSGDFSGDMMVLVGTLIYCSTNVWQEHQMKSGLSPIKWLSLMGIFGSLIVLTESLCLEMDQIRQIASISQSDI